MLVLSWLFLLLVQKVEALVDKIGGGLKLGMVLHLILVPCPE